MDPQAEGHAKHDSEQAGHQHPHRQEIAQIHALGHKAAEKHEEGIGEEIAGVQQAQVGLGLLLRLAVNFRDPGLASGVVAFAIAVVAVKKGLGVLNDRDGLAGQVVGDVGQVGEDEDGQPEHYFSLPSGLHQNRLFYQLALQTYKLT